MTVPNNPQPARKAAVYRLYAADGSLLYIGSSYNPERRYRDHYSKPWWPLVARRAEEWHPSKDDAYAAEMKAIAAEEPAHNHMGTPQYVPPSEKAAAQRRHISGELTVKEIMTKHGISRQSLHTYRQDPGFPSPVSRPGTGGLRWRQDEVAAWFRANPKQQGKKREQFVSHQQGDSVSTTVDPRIAILSALNDPPYNEVAEKRCVPWGEAEKMLAAYRRAVLLDAADKLDESETLRDLTDDHMSDVNAAANELRRMAEQSEASDG
ncbi:GIY-YIG nuclease family protein [Streptomyces sp. NPDC008240]|uniref:GIY-YIG nuclease family protein n=1 Tax=Streptomyces sp. NPDC008240 TaxID=3364822 RepID=UPI0036E477A5